jgi:hypothetical protein
LWSQVVLCYSNRGDPRSVHRHAGFFGSRGSQPDCQLVGGHDSAAQVVTEQRTEKLHEGLLPDGRARRPCATVWKNCSTKSDQSSFECHGRHTLGETTTRIQCRSDLSRTVLGRRSQVFRSGRESLGPSRRVVLRLATHRRRRTVMEQLQESGSFNHHPFGWSGLCHGAWVLVRAFARVDRCGSPSGQDSVTSLATGCLWLALAARRWPASVA